MDWPDNQIWKSVKIDCVGRPRDGIYKIHCKGLEIRFVPPTEQESRQQKPMKPQTNLRIDNKREIQKYKFL